MKESRGVKTRRVLSALLEGKVLTPNEANEIGKTSDATRMIRKLRETYPIKDERVVDEAYHKYWLDEEFVKAWKEGRVKLTVNGVEVKDASITV